MSFDGPALSIDDEGSILFDGEKIIVNVPVGHELLEHIGSEESIPFPVVYTHPSHHKNQQPSPGTPSLDDNPAFIKEQAQAFNENVRQERESARNMESEPNTPDVQDDLPAETQPDIREKEVLEVCGEFCQQNPQAMTAVMNLIEGFDPDDDEQTLEERVSNHLRTMGLIAAFGYGDWDSTRLEPIADSTAARIVDYYFDKVEAYKAALAAIQVDLTPAQGQVHAGIGGSEQPEINLLTQYHLKETYPDWDASWTEKEDLENFLEGKLKTFIDSFDEGSVSWDALTVEEMIAFYRNQMAALTATSWKRDQDTSDEYYQLIQAEFDRATGLLSMAKAIPLDDSEAFAATFGIADPEVQRKYVQDQLTVIYKHLGIAMPENHLVGRSATELNYELYYRLNYDVPRFMSLDENEKDNRIGNFLHEYREEAYLNPEDVIDRLQGTYRQPDVLGFLFIMGLSIAFEPVDYALTAVDVIQALSEGDIESAVGNAILGAAPLVNSRMDDVLQPFLNRFDNVRLLPARIGSTLLSRDELRRLEFSDEMIDIFEHGGGTGPGIGASTHTELMDLRETNGWAQTRSNKPTGIIKQNHNFLVLRDQYGYNIVNEPTKRELAHPQIRYDKRTYASGRPINSVNKNPDYIIEGRVFDAYTVGGPTDIPSAYAARNRIWDTLTRKVPSQADRLVIDLSYTDLTSDELTKYLSDLYTTGDPNIANLKEVIVMKDYNLSGIWVQPTV